MMYFVEIPSEEKDITKAESILVDYLTESSLNDREVSDEFLSEFISYLGKSDAIRGLYACDEETGVIEYYVIAGDNLRHWIDGIDRRSTLEKYIDARRAM